MVGIALLGAGLVLGYVIMNVGPAGTGELALDEYLGVHRIALLVSLALAIHLVFGPVVAPLALMAIGLVIWRRNRLAAITLVAVTVVGWLSVALGKVVFHRGRPPSALVHSLVLETGANSFPSGHTAFAFALVLGILLALGVAGRSTWPAWLLGLPVAVLVGASRVYAGAHYLGDVIAAPLFASGAVALLVAAWLSVPAVRRHAWITRVRQRAGSGASR